MTRKVASGFEDWVVGWLVVFVDFVEVFVGFFVIFVELVVFLEFAVFSGFAARGRIARPSDRAVLMRTFGEESSDMVLALITSAISARSGFFLSL